MRNMKKLLSLLLVLAMVLTMAAGCDGSQADPTTEPTQAPTENNSADQQTYTVTVTTQGGMVMSGIDVYVYADATLGDLKQYGRTDDYGTVSFTLPRSDSYTVTLSGVPKGYSVEASYGFSGSQARIALTSGLITDGDLSSQVLGLGSVMYDFSVITPDGTTVTLSKMLEEKDMVLLNFWYTTCTYCVAEFPYMQQAYEQYQDSVGIIALNPFEQDAAIESFQAQHGLTFPMASCPAAWSNVFGISGYPTSIVVDRYGVICLIEAGGITSLRPFMSAFDHFTGEDYEQVLCQSIGALVTDVEPTFTMESSETIAQAINNGHLDLVYRPETEDDNAHLSWPFILTEKDGFTCLKASNQQIDSSFAILYADVYLQAGQAVGFDYLCSSETACDILYVIVNDEDIYAISGERGWNSCYPWVALEDGTYELALCYIKDESTNVGDDTVYIKNMRVIDAAEIDVPTYIPRYAATTTDGFEYDYVDIVLGEDGYYHVGTADGPLLLADLMGYTAFNEEKSVFSLVYDQDVKVNGQSYYDVMVDNFTLASNSELNGVCTVNEDLAQQLKVVASVAGFDGTDNEWLKICKYFQVYGTGDTQLDDPVRGLSTFSTFEAKLGSDNYFYYDRAIIPRGLLAKFVPDKSGVYRITSRNESQDGVEGWIFGEGREQLYVYEHCERMYKDNDNVSMLYYMEAGTPYYINIAFWDMYEVGYIYYDIEYVAPEYDLFRLASPGFFTYDTNATGDAMYYLIAGGAKVVLGEDGYYYEDKGLDEMGNQIYGSLLYCDFMGNTSLFDTAIATTQAVDENGNAVQVPGMIDKHGFDFSKSEDDLYILSFLNKYDGDVAATDEYLRTLWGADYEAYAQLYQLEEVYEGIYHGKGEDMTQAISAYLDKMLDEAKYPEREGCVIVDEELARILQQLMDKYTFENVDNSWTKLCYYYQHLGPQD